jgi:hypothetical protein
MKNGNQTAVNLMNTENRAAAILAGITSKPSPELALQIYNSALATGDKELQKQAAAVLECYLAIEVRINSGVPRDEA